ncbi:protein Atu4866 [Lentzea fradiae]|uniref:Protein Atu4866 n=1 Tax=Lentzea fradiae TaxID=200378 RepID=A0A1G7UNR0_9PSEU|nr:Atu4866 domain-containing protein [Lentzea fradiae]SDG48370.1 protein Atu4866 [Lentzea fradiae]
MTTTGLTRWNAQALERAGDGSPLLFTNAIILTGDPVIGNPAGDLLVGGDLVVGVGPGIIAAAEDDGANVVDCTGTVIVPAVVDGLGLLGLRGSRQDLAGVLVPGRRADFLVVPGGSEVDAATALRTRPEDVRAAVVGGVPVLWDGEVLAPQEEQSATSIFDDADLSGHPRLGTWIDESGFLHQHLTADGRYDETRGGREHAFQGRYTIIGDRIEYLDDLGFWAFGDFVGDELHHAGYVMRRAS